MSLPSPLSVGDILLLGKVAYRIAQALSTGTKSASAEFVEVQTLLFSLKEAFDLLARTFLENSRNEDSHELKRQPELFRVLNNCHDVLLHLESFVEKYLILDPTTENQGDISPSDVGQGKPQQDVSHGDANIGTTSRGDASQQPAASNSAAREGDRARKLREDFKRSWKKIAWTKEGGDIGKLKQTLIAHTNALQLIVAVYNGGQQADIKGKVDMIHVKLDNIYEWFLVNVKTPASTTTCTRASEGRREGSRSETPAPSTSPVPLFSVLCQQKPADPTSKARVICPRATFSSKFLAEGDCSNFPAIGSYSLFCCLCAKSEGYETRGLNASSSSNDHSNKLQFTLLPISLLVQTLEESHPRTWQIYLSAAGSNSPVSILLSSASPSCISDIEEVTHKLGALQIASRSQNDLGSSTALVRLSSDGFSLLSSRAFIQHLTPRLLSIRLVVNRVGLLVSSVQSLQLDQHASAAPPQAWSEESPHEVESIGFSNEQGFQITVVCNSTASGALAGPQTERYVFNVTYESAISAGKGIRYATMYNVFCLYRKTADAEPQTVQCDEVEFEFQDSDAAEEFRAKLSGAKRTLRLQYFQQCRKGEHTIYQRKVGDIGIGHLVLQDAQLKVIRDLSTNRHRLILLGHQHTASACIELPADFLASLAGSSQKQAQRYRTYLVDIREDGVDIVENSVELDLISSLNHEKIMRDIPVHIN